VKKIALITGLTITLAGCTWLTMPYQDEPLCKKGTGSGYCSSISEVDKKTDTVVKKDSAEETYKLKHVKEGTCKECQE
jgi:hypothetical protein